MTKSDNIATEKPIIWHLQSILPAKTCARSAARNNVENGAFDINTPIIIPYVSAIGYLNFVLAFFLSDLSSM